MLLSKPWAGACIARQAAWRADVLDCGPQWLTLQSSPAAFRPTR